MELKLWRGKKQHEKGLLQLSDYLDRLSMKEGYLVIFDLRTPKYCELPYIDSLIRTARSEQVTIRRKCDCVDKRRIPIL